MNQQRQQKKYLKIKAGSMWMKRTKSTGAIYYSVSIELPDGSMVSAALFSNKKGKESHPDFRTLPEKPEQHGESYQHNQQSYPQDQLFDPGPPPEFNQDEEVPF